MINRSFFGFSKSHLAYGTVAGPPLTPDQMPLPHKATYLYKGGKDPNRPLCIQKGQPVKTGQRVPLYAEGEGFFISSVTGTIADFSVYAGDFGGTWVEITVAPGGEDIFDDGFAALGEPDLKAAIDYLGPIPGAPELSLLDQADPPIHTIVVSGVERDLLAVTAQHAVTSDIDAIPKGIAALKKISGIENVVLVVPRDLTPGFGHIGARLKAADTLYPAGLPKNIMYRVLGTEVPAGKSCASMGVAFFRAEAVAAVGRAFTTGRIPVQKLLTLIDANGGCTLISARIGTPVSEILNAHGITVNDGDRLIFGGPMTGEAVYSEDHPVEPDTDAIMVQAGGDIPFASDYPCISCGECIRVCPAHVPVDMLVRFLEAGQYEEAADAYDLYSCLDCGLCSFVCVAKIPIFQYIKLAKYELGRIHTAEASNE